MPGLLGLDEGRYLVRDEAEGEPEAVLVVTIVGAPPRRSRFAIRRSQVRPASVEDGPEPLNATRLTIVDSKRRFTPDEAGQWLERISGDADALERFIGNGVAIINRAIHAQRAASMDPYIQDVSPQHASAVRVGYGSGQAVADGRWTQAVRIPPETARRQRRADALKPQERVASVLGARQQVAPFETMILRARLDLDQGRAGEAAMQLHAGVEALLAHIPEGVSGDELRDLEALDELREPVETAAATAAAGALDETAQGQVGEALALCERILRRRRILS